MPRRIDWRRAKAWRCYTVNELAEAFGVHPHSVRAWIRAGLTAIDGGRPALFLGADVQAFGHSRTYERKTPCAPGEIYCAPCRSPRRPLGDVVQYRPMTESAGYLQGECPICARTIQRFTSQKKLAAAAGDLRVVFPGHQSDIRDCESTPVNCDSKE